MTKFERKRQLAMIKVTAQLSNLTKTLHQLACQGPEQCRAGDHIPLRDSGPCLICDAEVP